MSDFNNLITQITSVINDNIKPQFLQIANIELVKQINTGDRIKDGALVIIFNSLISLSFSTTYFGLKKIYRFANNKYFTKKNETKYKIILKDVLEKIKKEDVAKYSFKYPIEDSMGHISNDINFMRLNTYLSRNNIIDDYGAESQVELYQNRKLSGFLTPDLFFNTIKTFNLLSPMNVNGSVDKKAIKNYFMPIEFYINEKGEKEYIFLHDGNIVSNSYIELNNFVIRVLEDCMKRERPEIMGPSQLKIEEAQYETGTRMTKNNIGELNPKINFGNIYFDNKPILLDWIDKFVEKKLYPEELSLANKLGILLYGPPGTGKTGCICALANKLKRDVLIIKTLSLNGHGQNALKTLITENQSKCVIVFDEIDYLLESNLKDENEASELDNLNRLLVNSTNNKERTNIMKMISEYNNEKNRSVIDIRFILGLLDGIGNDEDRVIIATTNNPEKINPLFLRPGRFDVTLKLGYCSLQMFKDIVQTKYKNLDDEFYKKNDNLIMEILNLNVTPLVLINKLVVSTNADELLDHLKDLPQQNYISKPKI